MTVKSCASAAVIITANDTHDVSDHSSFRPGGRVKAGVEAKPSCLGSWHTIALQYSQNFVPCIMNIVSSRSLHQAQQHGAGSSLMNHAEEPLTTRCPFLLTSDDLDLRNTMTIPQYHTNLRRRSASLRKLADIVHDLLRRGFEPGGN